MLLSKSAYKVGFPWDKWVLYKRSLVYVDPFNSYSKARPEMHERDGVGKEFLISCMRSAARPAEFYDQM